MNNRLNKEVPPLKSQNPIFSDKATKKAKWSYQTTDIIDGYDEPISKTQEEPDGCRHVRFHTNQSTHSHITEQD